MRNWRITWNSPVVLGFALACTAATVLTLVTGGRLGELLFMTYHSSLMSPLTYIRFFTHVLGHSGWEHLIGNMSYILLLGPLLEEKYGSDRVFQIIMITTLSTGIVNYIFFPQAALLGASGVVFAFILLSSFTRIRDGEIPITFILVAAIYLGQQIYSGLFVSDNVANFAHIIGGLVGAAVGFKSAGGRR